MFAILNLEIGGVNLAVSSLEPIILHEPPAAYTSFLIKNSSFHDKINITINFDLDSLPRTDKMTRVFDTGESWSLFQNDDSYFIILCPPASDKKPVWAAQFDRDVTKVNLFLGEKFIHQKNGNLSVSNPVSYPLDQILLMYFLARKSGALIHSSGVASNGKGFIFPGRSGSGKTTLSQELSDGKRLLLLSDDRVIVRKLNNTFEVFGTPWAGEGGIALNKHFPLSGMFFISHAEHNRIEDIKPQKALEMLLPVTSIPWYDPEVMDKVLHFCDDLTSSIPAYNLSFKPGVEVADVFEKFISI